MEFEQNGQLYDAIVQYKKAVHLVPDIEIKVFNYLKDNGEATTNPNINIKTPDFTGTFWHFIGIQVFFRGLYISITGLEEYEQSNQNYKILISGETLPKQDVSYSPILLRDDLDCDLVSKFSLLSLQQKCLCFPENPAKVRNDERLFMLILAPPTLSWNNAVSINF